MLNDQPMIKKMFIKYNTSMLSSGPVERLFAFAKIFDVAKQKKLNDDLFEQWVMTFNHFYKTCVESRQAVGETRSHSAGPLLCTVLVS